jgi:23S rRNA pseudouridine1911/1915/1917 synthase
MQDPAFPITPDEAGQTLAAIIRRRRSNPSWTHIRKLIASRHIQLNGELCLDPARRVKEGDLVTILMQSVPLPKAQRELLKIRHLDEHVVVVEKSAGISTVRHPAERDWTAKRKALSPTVEDRVQLAIAARLKRPLRSLPRLRIVHRLDKETSGLVVFARSPLAEAELGRQFRRHTVVRKYLALVPGFFTSQTIRSSLVRDRGDGRRGSTTLPGVGKEAITHVEVVERLPGYTLLSCRLETGRTHQIRIHLAEAGHPVCGEKVYNRRRTGELIPDESGSPRLFLHAAELGFQHPVTRQMFHWEMPLPPELATVLDRMRA